MCDTTINETEWLFPVKNIAESSKALQEQLILKLEIAKCFQIESGTYVEKCRAKTAAERTREYRQRQKLKCELDRSDVHVPGISLKSEIKTADERQRDVKCKNKINAERCRKYRQRMKWKRELERSDELQRDVKCKAKTATKKTREYRHWQKLKCELDKSDVVLPGICLKSEIKTADEQQQNVKFKAKTAAERTRDYRQRQKSKCELDRSDVDVPGICSKLEIKTADERQRDYQQRQKLKRVLKNLDGRSILKTHADPETKTTKEQNQDCRKAQKLLIINDLKKYCDIGSLSQEDSEQGNQEYGGEQTIECCVKKCGKVELFRKEHLPKDAAISAELNPNCPKLNEDLETCVEQTSICGNIGRTYNSSAEYFFYSMIE